MLDQLRAEEVARMTFEAREEKLTSDSNDGGYVDADGRLRVVLNGVNPPVERQDDLIEAAGGLAIETPLALVSGAAAAVVSRLQGLYTDIACGKFGTPEDIQLGDEAASQLAQRMTFRTQTAVDNARFLKSLRNSRAPSGLWGADQRPRRQTALSSARAPHHPDAGRRETAC
jgi:hypothetical protein